MQFKDSLGAPLLHPTETGTEELHEMKPIKGAESSNCCIWSPPSDMAPMYAIEIAKLWIKQNCRGAIESLRHKVSNVKQRNDQQIKGISTITSQEAVVQCQQIMDIDVMTPREKVVQCHQMKDIGVMTSGKGVTCYQHINDVGVMTTKEKFIQSQKINDNGVMTSSEKGMWCQQIKDIGVVTSGERVTGCHQIKDIGVMTSKEKVTQSQQIKDIGVMTSEEKFTQCQQVQDIGVVTSRGKVTSCQQIKNIGVMTSRENVTQSQQIKNMGVMTSRENVTQSQQNKDIGVMTSRENFTQSQKNKNIGVMTSGEIVRQCMQKYFSDEYTKHGIMAVDGPGGYGTPPIVAQCSKTDHILKSSNMIHPFQKCSGSDKQYTVKENVNRLIPCPSPLEARERQTVKQTGIYPPTKNGNIEIMNVSVMKNSCANKCAALSASEPIILKNTTNKHRFHENNSFDKKYSVTSQKTLFQNGRSLEKCCGDSNSVICNVMHKLPVEGSGKSSYNRLLHESGLPHEVDSKKLYVPELLHENNTYDTTQMSGNYDISLRKTAPSEPIDSSCETKDQYKITCNSVHETQENSGLQAVHTSNIKVNKSNYYPKTDLNQPVNVSPEMYCNRDLEITKTDDRINILESKGNSLEFPKMGHYFTYNLEAQNVSPWVQGTQQEIGCNGYDTKIRTKPYETANTTRKLKGVCVDNVFQDESNVCGQRGLKEMKQKNNNLYFKKRKKADEGITMNGIRLTFTDTQADDENTQKFTKKRSIWSFLQNLLRGLDPSKKREKQPVYNKSSTFFTLSFKKHKSRKLKRETRGHGHHEKQYITSTSGYDRRTILAEEGQHCNYSIETNSSTEKIPSSSSQENIANNYKTHSLTYPVLQDVCQAFASNSEQPTSLDNHKMKHSLIDNKQLRLDQRTTSYRKQSSPANNYTSSKAYKQVHGFSRRKEKYYGQPQICPNRQEAANLLQDCKHSEELLNSNVTVPALFQDETPTLNTDESDKNVVVMVAEVHSSSVVVNPDIMEELKQQRQDINSLKKMLANKEKKEHNTNYSKNTRKNKPQHIYGIPPEFVMPVIPDYNKNIIKFQTASDKQNAFGVTETPLPEQILSQKCESLSLQDYFAFNSISYKNGGQAPDLTANHHADICYDSSNEYTWRNNTRHSHRRAEKKHLRYVTRHCRNYKTNFWNKILSLFR